MSDRLNSNNYIGIQASMVTELGLQGEELLVFAIIFGFSQDGVGWYLGGRNYICKWLGCSEKKAGRILQSLYEKGLLIKESDKGKAGIRYRYQVKFSTVEKLSTIHEQCNRDKSSLLSGQNVPFNRDKTSHINIKGNNNLNNRSSRNSYDPPKPTHCPNCNRMMPYLHQLFRYECLNCFSKFDKNLKPL